MQSQPQPIPDDLARENATLRLRIAELEAENAALRQAQPSAGADIRPPFAEPLLAAVLEQLPVGVAIAESPSGRLLMHNEEAIRLLGHPLLESADYTGYTQYGALHPDGRPYAPEEYPIARALLHRHTIPFEDMHYRRGDGTHTIFAVNAAPIRDASGAIVAVVSTFHDIAHQRRLEQELPESEARFAAAFRVSPMALVISTVDEGRILDVNSRFLELFGRDRESVINHTSNALGMFAAPTDRERAVALLRQEGRVRNLDVDIVGAGGEHRHVLLATEPLQFAGTPCILTALYDITERVRAEATLRANMDLLREREIRLQTIIEHAGTAVWSIDSDYRLTMANSTFLQSDRLYAGNVPTIGQIMPPDWVPEPARSAFRALYDRALHGETVRDERIDWTPSGDLLAWELTFTPIVGLDGRVLGVTCFGRDVTARKTAELALQRSESLYRAIVTSLPGAGVLVVTPDLRYLVAEGPVLEQLGWGRERLEGRAIAEALEPDIAGVVIERFTRALAGEAITVERSYAGRTLWTRFVALRDTTGTVQGAMALVLDETERKRLEAQLLQAQKMESIGQLAGGIAHDFNNLLTAISGYADLAIDDLPADLPAAADIAQIQQAVDRAAALTRQLLTFARRQPMEMRALDLNDLVRNLENLLRRLIGEHIQLVVRPAPDLGQIIGDPAQIEQVLVNLAVNARDAMPTGGTLTIATSNIDLGARFAHGHIDLPAGPYVLVTVSDTGVGIAPDLQPHLFEPFFTTKPPGQGTGLGLATCYGIVKQHGGTIWIYSEVNHGTVAKIYLPRQGAGGTLTAIDAAPEALPGGTETILLAEDEPSVRTLTARVLRGCGYTVLEAADGVEAVRLAETYTPRPIHLLLSDVVMPHLDGMAAATRIRACYPSIVLLFMSGYTSGSGPLPGGPLPAAPLLQKPFTPSGLAIAVRAALDR